MKRSCNGPRGNSTELDGSSSIQCGWLEQEEQKLCELQETLSCHKQRFRGTPLSRATPIEPLRTARVDPFLHGVATHFKNNGVIAI